MSTKQFDDEHKVMKMYVDNAGLYIKLSSAGLALTVTFSKEILGIKSPLPDPWLEFMWGGFLVAILAGAFYQYLAAKYIENLLPAKSSFTHLNWLADRPGAIYGIMLIGFYSSAVSFTIRAIQRLNL